MHINIFDDDAFGLVTMTEGLEDAEFKPGLIGSMNLFRPIPISTTSVAVERRGSMLSLIPTSPRGAPLSEGQSSDRNLRRFETVRIAKGHTILSSEIQNVRAFGAEDELETAVEYVAGFQQQLIEDVELTWENLMLGAIQGKVLDADGAVLVDWFDTWNITKPAPINFALGTDTTDVEAKCREVIRKTQKAAKGSWNTQATVVGLAGDTFFDKLTGHKKVRGTFLNTQQAQLLNAYFGIAQGERDSFRAGSYAMVNYGGILFINYRGTDEFDADAAEGSTSGKEALGIKADRCKFFPMGARGVFQEAFAPGESFEVANTIGRKLYSMMIRDEKRNFWVRPEVYSYPLHICTRPEMLLEGVAQ